MGALAKPLCQALALLLVVCIGVRLAAMLLQPVLVPAIVLLVVVGIAFITLGGRWSS